MLIIYRSLINLVFLLSPLILIYRILKKKEDIIRFKEKFCFSSQIRRSGKLIWFHGASVGELQSIIPLLEKFEKNKKISQILVTSNTLSSSRVISKFKFKKVVHQFFPIDQNLISGIFLNYWKPSAALFVDSEVWPNILINLKKRNIPIILLNGRITKKSFNRWISIKKFSKKIFGNFNLCLSSSKISKNYLVKLGAKNVKIFGNLKFSQSENEKIIVNKKFRKFISKKKVWCASSTHDTEEKLCGVVHEKLKSKYKNLLTVIIPRHINRTHDIKYQLEQMNLKVHTHDPEKKIDNKTDIYLVNSYGTTKSFYSICKNVFLGGSLINHGGQNPLEAVRFGCNVLHGPNIENFYEIYEFLKKNNFTKKIKNQSDMINNLTKLLSNKLKNKKKNINLNLVGKKILNKTYNEIVTIL